MFWATKVTLEIYDTSRKPGEPLGIRRLIIESETKAPDADAARIAALKAARELAGTSAAFIHRERCELS